MIPKPTSARGRLLELALIVVVAIGLALAVQAYAVKPYTIPSGSMLPTLAEGQRVLVNRFSHRLGADPEIGDVIVFHPPVGADDEICGVNIPEREPGQPCPEPVPRMSETNFVKRVVAGPGDTLSIEDGIPIVDGEPVTGDWEVRLCESCDFEIEITIPPGHYFMMGDNRGASDDSRYWGPIPRDWIIGEAFFTYWPPDRVGGL